jgi:anti-sigma factor RsiW
MTDCNGRPAEELLESYVQGTLPETEARKFEEHYFDCPRCLAEVEALQTAAMQLGARPRVAPKAPIPWPRRIGVLSAVAALLIVGVFVFRESRAPGGSAVAVNPAPPASTAAPAPGASSPAPMAASEIADLSIPVFQASALRGPGRNVHFAAGMQAYAGKNYLLAEKDLAQVPADDADGIAARFYAGVCQMQLGHLPAAAAALQSVADGGDSPQQEASLYYLAQTALLNNDVAEANRDLTRTVALHGDFERRARAELDRISHSRLER